MPGKRLQMPGTLAPCLILPASLSWSNGCEIMTVGHDEKWRWMKPSLSRTKVEMMLTIERSRRSVSGHRGERCR